MNSKVIKEALSEFIEIEKAEFLPKFFQVYPGGYGEGDKFLGVRVPNQRKVASKYYKGLPLHELSKVIQDQYHEMRLTGFFILVYKYSKFKSETDKEELVKFYLEHLPFVNNWDLVDSTCSQILGDYLIDKDRSMLYVFAKDNNLWVQRISIITTLAFIKKLEFQDTFEISKLLINHPHDLIHKAVGWMLREVGNRDLDAELSFLDDYTAEMPLRYAIEKFPEKLRLEYLKNR